MLDVPLQKSEVRPVKLGGKCQIHMSNVKSDIIDIRRNL